MFKRHHRGLGQILVIPLIIFTMATSVFAARQDWQSAVGNMLFHDLVPDHGYGYYSWNDRPYDHGSAKCSSSLIPVPMESFVARAGINQHSECIANNGLPSVGPFEAVTAIYSFYFNYLSNIKVTLKVPAEYRASGGIPEQITIKSGYITTSFSCKPEEETATLNILNQDPLGSKKAHKDAMEKMGEQGSTILPYLEALRTFDKGLADTLQDYGSLLGIDADADRFGHKYHKLLDSPVLGYLLATRTNAGDNALHYQVIFDQIRVINPQKSELPDKFSETLSKDLEQYGVASD